MGQKVHPTGFRLAVNKDWRSKWYAPDTDFADQLHSDLAIRRYLREKLQMASIAKVVIERAWNSVRVTLHTSRPGLVIGRKGSEIERMTNDISQRCGGANVKIDIFEIKQPELDAQLVAENVAVQLERRISFRRAMKRAVQTAMDFGADGIRIRCAGRLGGADIARTEQYREGKVPLQTLRVPIDFGFAEARTTWGIIGVKCWMNRPEEGSQTPPRGGGNQRRGRGEGGGRGGDGARRRSGGPGGGGGGGRSGGGNAGGGGGGGGGTASA
jgi:small subunit ribosomal protein S3